MIRLPRQPEWFLSEWFGFLNRYLIWRSDIFVSSFPILRHCIFLCFNFYLESEWSYQITLETETDHAGLAPDLGGIPVVVAVMLEVAGTSDRHSLSRGKTSKLGMESNFVKSRNCRPIWNVPSASVQVISRCASVSSRNPVMARCVLKPFLILNRPYVHWNLCGLRGFAVQAMEFASILFSVLIYVYDWHQCCFFVCLYLLGFLRFKCENTHSSNVKVDKIRHDQAKGAMHHSCDRAISLNAYRIRLYKCFSNY